MKDISGMTIFELKDYVNSLSNEEFEQFEKEVDLSEMDSDLEVAQLLSASRLYDYLQYKQKGNITIEL